MSRPFYTQSTPLMIAAFQENPDCRRQYSKVIPFSMLPEQCQVQIIGGFHQYCSLEPQFAMIITVAGHILCWSWFEFARVRKQPHWGAARQAQEVSRQEEVLECN